jgi:hypothetical protein
MEVWKKIEGFEDYEVSTNGVVISNKYSKKRILKKELSKGYLRVSLCKENKVKRFLVHRLVALSFLKNEDNKKCVNHKDGNKLNNSLGNLEWSTHSENEIHSYNYLNKKNPIRKLDNSQVIYIRNKAVKGRKGNIKYLADNFNVDVSTIYNILKNKYYATT